MPCGKFGTLYSSFCTLTNSVHCNANWLLCSLPRLNSKILNFQIIILDPLLVYKQKEMAEFLIENGANVNSTLIDLKTPPLHFALHSENVTVGRLEKTSRECENKK